MHAHRAEQGEDHRETSLRRGGRAAHPGDTCDATVPKHVYNWPQDHDRPTGRRSVPRSDPQTLRGTLLEDTRGHSTLETLGSLDACVLHSEATYRQCNGVPAHVYTMGWELPHVPLPNEGGGEGVCRGGRHTYPLFTSSPVTIHRPPDREPTKLCKPGDTKRSTL